MEQIKRNIILLWVCEQHCINWSLSEALSWIFLHQERPCQKVVNQDWQEWTKAWIHGTTIPNWNNKNSQIHVRNCQREFEPLFLDYLNLSNWASLSQSIMYNVGSLFMVGSPCSIFNFLSLLMTEVCLLIHVIHE